MRTLGDHLGNLFLPREEHEVDGSIGRARKAAASPTSAPAR